MGKPFITHLTFQERVKIENHIRNGLSCSQAAKLIGRSKNGVVQEVRRAGGKAYSAKIGQNISDFNLQEKYRKLSERNKGNKVTFKMKERIENLEMQLEILHETLKEIMNK